MSSKLWKLTTLIVLLGFIGTLVKIAQAQVVSARVTILTGAEARKVFKQCSRSTPANITGYWTPTSAQAREMERRLPAYLKSLKWAYSAEELKALKASGGFSEKQLKELMRSFPKPAFASYHRQIAGYTQKGERFLYVNAFDKVYLSGLSSLMRPNGKPFDWRKEAVDICDGNVTFYGLEYNLRTKRFANLRFNNTGFPRPR